MLKPDPKSGQVVVEMILILPVFLGMVFMVMEVGYISFRTIVLNHAAYECARIGGMVWTESRLRNKVQEVYERLVPAVRTGDASIVCTEKETLEDPQARQLNKDLECVATERVKLIFPISSILISRPRGSGKYPIRAVVRMPIEQPLRK